jgi:hypothetical protein
MFMFSGRQLNFTYDRPSGSLDVIVLGPTADGILQILYFLAGGLELEVASANDTGAPSMTGQPAPGASSGFVVSVDSWLCQDRY